MVIVALCMIAYGILADLVDENLAMGESSTIVCGKCFVVAIVEVFVGEYLRALNTQDSARLLATNAARGFPIMLVSIDCMLRRWKNCPATWHGQFKGHKKNPLLFLKLLPTRSHGFVMLSLA
jgi:hypothetical protein